MTVNVYAEDLQNTYVESVASQDGKYVGLRIAFDAGDNPAHAVTLWAVSPEALRMLLKLALDRIRV
jgi:hypothetical protein